MTGARVLGVDDLSDDQVGALLERAGELADGAAPRPSSRRLGLLLLEPSLRTRTGFLAAAQRLGWPSPVEVDARRSSEVSMAESLHDTVAVLSAYLEVLVVRSTGPIGQVASAVDDAVHLVNAGDRGSSPEHPTQALIDLFAMHRMVGDVRDQHVAVCGDLSMRSARSLLSLLTRVGPRRVTVVTDESLGGVPDAATDLPGLEVAASWAEVGDVDSLHAVGMPHGATGEGVRTRLRVDSTALSALSPRGRVFSPMPVIDEVASAVRTDPRVAFVEQSRLGLHVRTALLETMG